MKNVLKDWEKLLLNPFPQADIEWRVQQSGTSKNNKPWAMVLPYVTARACQDRLDEVLGMDGWQDEYTHLTNGVKCTLSIKPPNCKEWIVKTNGAPETAVESFKGGFSKAFVRTCCNVGIGRYLYKTGTFFAECSATKSEGWQQAKTKDNTYFYWKPPMLPSWALPQAIVSKKSKDFNIEEFFDMNDISTFNALECLQKGFKQKEKLTLDTLTDDMRQYVFDNQQWFVETYRLGE